METTLLAIVALTLIYKLIMPFVACLVPAEKMKAAAKYIARTERRFPTQQVLKWIGRLKKRKAPDGKKLNSPRAIRSG